MSNNTLLNIFYMSHGGRLTSDDRILLIEEQNDRVLSLKTLYKSHWKYSEYTLRHLSLECNFIIILEIYCDEMETLLGFQTKHQLAEMELRRMNLNGEGGLQDISSQIQLEKSVQPMGSTTLLIRL